MKFTNKEFSIDTDTKLIKIFHPETYTRKKLYSQLVKLWCRHTQFCRHPFPMEATDLIRLDNGWVLMDEDVKLIKLGTYGRP